jgi:outer membrane protein assembly factor BamB
MPDRLQRAITAIRAGDTATGRELLTELLRENPQHEDAWMWMTAVVQTHERRLYCLERVLKINPNNETARRAVSRLRQEQEDKTAQVEPRASKEQPKDDRQKSPAIPRRLNLRLVAVGVVVICVIGIIGLGIVLIRKLSLSATEPATLPSASPFASPTATLVSQADMPTARPTPQLIADDGDGGSSEPGPVKWMFHAEGPVWAAPIVANGVVYVGNYKDGAASTEFFAVDARTGLEKWRLETEGPWASPIAVVDGIAYVGDCHYLYVLDSESGQELWRHRVDLSSILTIADGAIYFRVGDASGGLYARNAQTGQGIWSFDISGTVDSVPIVADGTVYFTTSSNVTYALDNQTGSEKWNFRQSDGANRALIVRDGMVYLGGQDGVLYALDGESGREEWKFQAQDEIYGAAVIQGDMVCLADGSGSLYAIDGQTGQEVWRYEALTGMSRDTMSILSIDDTLLVGTSTGLWAFKGDTGEEIWREKSVGETSEPPVVADGAVYFTLGSSLYMLDIQSGQEQGKLRIDSWGLSPPAVQDGTIYVGSRDGDLYAVDADALVAASQEESAADMASQPKEATFRANPQRTGFYDTKGVRELGGLKWKLQAQILALTSPAIADGMVHYGSFALDVDHGELTWATWSEPPNYSDDALAISSPAVFSGTVYYGDADGLLYAVDSLTGEIKWTFETPAPIASSPVVCKGTVFFGGADGYLYNLDAQTGEEIWRLETGGNTDVACENGTIYFGSMDGYLYALDGQTTEEKWRHAGFGTPAIADGTVYLVTGPTGFAVFSEEDLSDNYVVAIDAKTGQEKWKVQIDAVTLPAVAEGKVYFGTLDGNLCALDSESGDEEWCFATSELILPSPSVADGVVYFGTGFWSISDTGYLYAIDGQTGQELWRFSAGPILTSPAVNDGVVYFNDSMGRFYAVQSKSPSVTAGDSHSDGTMARANLQRTGSYDVEAVHELRGVQWHFDTESLGAPPTIAGKTAYLCSGTYIHALDTETGEHLWRFATSGAFSSPAIADGVVYFGGYGGYVYAVDAETGLKKWRVTTRGFPSEDVMASSPAVYNGTVYIGSYDGHMYALDAETGQERWAFRTDGLVYSSPAIDAETLYFGSGDGFLYALDSQTGQEEWRFQTMGQIGATPAIADGTAYFRATDGAAYAVDSQNGSLKWRFPVRDKLISSPAVADGLVYYGTESGLYALDSQTGQESWFFETGTRVESSPVIADGVVYFGSDGGHLFAIDARTGQSKWYYRTGDRADPAPVVADGVVFAFGDGYLYALSEDVPAGATPLPTVVAKPTATSTPVSTPVPTAPKEIEVLEETIAPKGTLVIEEPTELPPPTRLRPTRSPDEPFESAMYRSNPQRTGAYDTTAVHQFTEVIWKVRPANAGYGPIVADGLLYFGGTDRYLYALDIQTGQEVWKFHGIYSFPAVASGSIYFGCADNCLCALDSQTGQERWKFETGGSVFSSPAVVDETVYFGSLDHYIYALDSQTGHEKWKFDTGDYMETDIAVAYGIVYFGSPNYVHALGGSTGQELWRFQTKGEHGVSEPVVADEMVYFVDQDVEDSTLHYNIVALDVYTGEEKWRVRVEAPMVAGFGMTPISIADGQVYIGDGKLRAFDGQTGKETWAVIPNGGTREQPSRSAISIADGIVYFGSSDGYLYAVNAKTGSTKWQFQAGHQYVSSVVIADGVLYFSDSEGYLYAIR